MSLPQPESPTLDQTEEEQAAIKALVDKYAKSNLHDAQEDPAKDGQKNPSEPRPMRVYTREQLLDLYRSPLVQLPPHMPELKQWFGDNEIALSKKESDLNSSGRGRFRRDPDDGDVSSRPPFRSALSQPSQMGNFKHQSLRSGDRDRERDGDKDREIRDKEGLRHLSEKYDRDRFGMLPASTRGKERESAPHLSASSSSRTSSQNQSSVANRRTEGRESQKKRPGENGDDWRRSVFILSLFIYTADKPSDDPSRNSRDDRDDRERARSRARESSRPRRSPSRSRRERDDGRDRPSRSDRDRDEHKREEYRRERDADRNQDGDSRHWRDDGKRDERMATRRTERDRDLRPRERGDHWEPSNDRRWAASDERDGRDKRTSGRDKKASGNRDELRDREDRREREREKEKEPAWMETYVPTSTSGILGGKSADGELDGIQAWKKGLKEKELQEKNIEISLEPDVAAGQDMEEKGLDEIQLFKLLMKREEEKKNSDGNPSSGPDVSAETKLPAISTAPLVEPHQISTLAQPRPSSTANPDSPGIISPPRDAAFKPPPPTITDGSPSISFSEKSVEYNPPAGSRLLALGRTSAKSPVHPLSGPSSGPPNGLAIETMVKPGTPRSQGFSPFEEQQTRLSEEHGQPGMSNQFDLGQRPSEKQHNSMVPANIYDDNNGQAQAGNKGSRFAKFFDSKAKESAPPGLKPQTPTGFLSSSPNPPLRQDQAMYGGGPPPSQERTMEDLFAMLNNSSQAQRASLLNHPTPHHPLNNGLLLNQAHVMGNLPSQPQHLQPNSRLDSLYDSRLDDRFVPDGMVPGLRTAPPRSRDNVGLYQEMPDEALQFHLQRLQQQQRGPEPFSGLNPQMFNPQGSRNMGLPLQQGQFRGGPSPGVHPHNQLTGLQQQRLPPGLANLGGRPPHDPAHIPGLQGHPNGPLHANLLPNVAPSQQQQFNNFAVNNLNFNNPQLRAVPSLHQLQNTGPHPGLGHMGLGNNMDLRSQNPNQILGIGGPSLPGPRGGNPMFNPQQSSHIQGPPLGGRQQPGHLPPHVPPHHMPPHYQQGVNGPNSGHTNELIALLMGGAPRE
ncbi:hypothetical protein D9756_003913 [Leucocoprinus leucothites]|uniref:Uncharacterized protein n=1 Tax=Leucocoprinus leucothites TaxID=201217 RepID=A0A8H5G0K1_9AGAR|nr:hypothetical protein D9756_003913 [Leucoagaricus leucothites]